ncbi:MAG: 16S rRNA (adenine(1518)-N(6)/adenine(1519)-N(6))-dimethyltransferase RsmA [Candidatus Paceibacterota bacterium]|jgi:16S rRNA (adenine1518-N6/adenine1519-N6)-dimethyltransferase
MHKRSNNREPYQGSNPVAKKSLGQNFLRSRKILDAVRDSIHITASDTVLEVGPGQGDLTTALLEKAGKVVAIEKDDRLIPFLQEKFKDAVSSNKFSLIHGDALEFDPSSISSLSTPVKSASQDSPNKRIFNGINYKIAANIPYYITGQFIRRFLSELKQPTDIALIIQKEVAERIIARDGKQSILSLSIKVYGEPAYIRTVSRSFFTPAPNVDSAILAIRNISKDFFTEISEEMFFKVIKTGFASKRKQLIGNLSSLVSREHLEQIFRNLHIDLKIRAEDMTLEQWREVVKKIHS